METISISQFKATCLAVLKDVNQQKKKVLITKRGEPIAEVVPVDYQNRDVPLKETVIYMGDIVSPVAEEEWKVLK